MYASKVAIARGFRQRTFLVSALLSVLVLVFIVATMGFAAAAVFLVLACIEFAFSFDNAVMNAHVLKLMDRRYQRLFLSVGIVIAVFGVRIMLPLYVVQLAAKIPLATVVDLALHHPALYAAKLNAALPVIDAFGGAFLLTLTLHFFLKERAVTKVGIVERPLRKIAKRWMPVAITAAVAAGISLFTMPETRRVVFAAGLCGTFAYTAMNGSIDLLGASFGHGRAGRRIGIAAFASFIYLEMLDASLSFDGVIGAFAITSDVVLIAFGLGVGALWVRSLTVYMVRRRTLEAYRYLDHGAHYAIGILATAMLLAGIITVPSVLTGFLCMAVIAAAVFSSRLALQR